MPAPLVWTYATGNYAWAVAVSGDGRHVIVGSDDLHTYFFDAKSMGGKPLWTHESQGYVRNVAISKNGTYAAASDTDGEVFFFRWPNSGPSLLWSYRSNSAVETLAMSDDCNYLVAGDRQGTISIFKTDLASPLVWKYVVSGGISAVSLSKSGSLAATATRGGLYFFASVSRPSNPIWIFDEPTSFPYVALSGDSSYIIAGGGDGYVYLVSDSGKLLDRQRLGGAISALSLSSSAGLVAAGSTNGTFSLYSVGEGLETVYSLHLRRTVTSAAVSENGQRVSIANINGTVSMFNQSSSNIMWTYDMGAVVHSLSISSNGQVTAAVSDTGGVYLFDETLALRSPVVPTVTFLSGIVGVAVAATIILAYLIRHRRTHKIEQKIYRSQ